MALRFQHFLGYGSTQKNQVLTLLKILVEDECILSPKEQRKDSDDDNVYVKYAFPWHAHTIRGIYTEGITICIDPNFFREGRHTYNTYWGGNGTEYDGKDFDDFLTEFDKTSKKTVMKNEEEHGIQGDSNYRYASFVGEILVSKGVPRKYFKKIVVRARQGGMSKSDDFILKALMKDQRFSHLFEIIIS